MKRPILDKLDLKILAILAKDCRTSYSSIASMIGLTPKSVNARVKNMVTNGIIEKFIVRVNPAAFGYRIAHVWVRTNIGITKDEAIRRIKQYGALAYYVHHMGRSCVAALIISKALSARILRSLSDSLKPATIISIPVSQLSVSTSFSETDLRILKCLLQSGARIELSEIAKKLGISEKTITRRLDRMKGGRLLDLSIQCDPAAMVGYIQFAIPMDIVESYFGNVKESMYAEFQENILYAPNVIDPNNWLLFVLFGQNIFTVDSALAKVDALKGVKTADVYILSKWQFFEDWIIREIDKRLPRTLFRRSI